MDKILIVEDDSEIAMLERDYLEIEGYETKLVDSGGWAPAVPDGHENHPIEGGSTGCRKS